MLVFWKFNQFIQIRNVESRNLSNVVTNLVQVTLYFFYAHHLPLGRLRVPILLDTGNPLFFFADPGYAIVVQTYPCTLLVHIVVQPSSFSVRQCQLFEQTQEQLIVGREDSVQKLYKIQQSEPTFRYSWQL